MIKAEEATSSDSLRTFLNSLFSEVTFLFQVLLFLAAFCWEKTGFDLSPLVKIVGFESQWKMKRSTMEKVRGAPEPRFSNPLQNKGINPIW